MSEYNPDSSNSAPQAVVGGPVLNKKSHFMFKAAAASLVAVMVATGYLLFQGQTGSPANEVGITGHTASVTITSKGFLPSQLQIKPGTTVTWINQTESAHQVGANPYPSHSSLPQLVSGVIGPHQSYSFVFDRGGTWLYQDDNNPLHNGSVVVK